MPCPAFTSFAPLPKRPYVEFAAGANGRQWWIHCRCRVCGPPGDYIKPCSWPARTNIIVGKYATLHQHG